MELEGPQFRLPRIELLTVLKVVAVLIVLIFWLLTNPGFPRLFYGNTPAETARILESDRTWGFRAIHKGISYGDAIIPEMRDASKNFTTLNGRNTYCFAQVLGGIKTPLACSAARELYGRKYLPHTQEALDFLCGGLALALQGNLKDSSALTSFICIHNAKCDFSFEPDFVDFAVEAIGETRDKSASKVLEKLLQQGQNGWHAEKTCIALGKIADASEAATLESCLKNPEFFPTAECFKALVAMGDPEAIPLAIERVYDDERTYHRDKLIQELEKTTGQRFGTNRKAWREWCLREQLSMRLEPTGIESAVGKEWK